MVRAAREPLTLVATGSLTNIAAALIIDPELPQHVEQLVLMGGANEFGNVTPAAEANIWQDPRGGDRLPGGLREAGDRAAGRHTPALITQDQADELAARGTPAAQAAAQLITERIIVHDRDQPQPIPHSAAVHDALCIAYLLEPEVLELHRMHVAAETVPGHSFGRTVLDVRRRSTQEPMHWWPSPQTERGSSA